MIGYPLWRGNLCFLGLQNTMNSGVLFWRKPVQSEFEQNKKPNTRVSSTAYAVVLFELQASWII
jgi:hypothetical protein